MQTAKTDRTAQTARPIITISDDQLAQFDHARRASAQLRHLENMLKDHEAGHARRREKLIQEINQLRATAESGLRQMAETLDAILSARGVA